MSFRAPPPLSVAAVFAAVLAAPLAPARAQDALSIDHLEFMRHRTTVIAPDRPLTVVLRGLPPRPAEGDAPAIAPDDVKARVGSTDTSAVLDVDTVMVRIPAGQRLGKTKVRVTVGRQSVEGEVEVVAKEDPRFAPFESDVALGAPGEAEDDRVKGAIRISRFVHVLEPAGERFEVEVTITAPLPDGARFEVSIALADPRVPLPLNVRLTSAGGKAAGTLPLERRAFAAAYEVRVLFDGTKQGPAVKRWIASQSEAARDAWLRIERVERVDVGTEAEVAEQQAAVRDHHRAIADEAQRLLLEIDRAYASASRSLFLDATGKFDPARWRAHVAPLAATPAEVDAFAADARFATARGNLRTDALEAWASTTLVPALTALDERRRTFSDAWLAPPSPRAEAISVALVAFVGQRIAAHARALYTAARLPVPPVFTDLPGATAPAPDSRPAFLAQRRLLLRTIGQGAVADAEEAPR